MEADEEDTQAPGQVRLAAVPAADQAGDQAEADPEAADPAAVAGPAEAGPAALSGPAESEAPAVPVLAQVDDQLLPEPELGTPEFLRRVRK